MREQFIFDQYGSISEARRDFLEVLLRDLRPALGLRTALDVGCGVGLFAQHLTEMNLTVTALDARWEHIAEARRRFPNIRFEVADVEDPTLPRLGSFDLTLCFGLLYHLENPFRAVRNLFLLTNTVLVIESAVIPNPRPLACLIDEVQSPDQGIRFVAFVLSESCLAKMLLRAGFQFVYRPFTPPDHIDFRNSIDSWKRRTILVASKRQLQNTNLEQYSEPLSWDPWDRPIGRQVARVFRFLRKPLREKGCILLDHGQQWWKR